MPRLLAIADDLTGANDIAVQFARRGVPALVALHPAPDLPALFDNFEVIVIDSESRHLSPDLARQRIHEIINQAAPAHIQHFYKKTDSTLRGNIGAELEALLSATAAPELPYIPGLPELGRTTRAGLQYLHGRLLHETEFASDPRNPIRVSSVSRVLQQQTTLTIRELPFPQPASSFRGITILDISAADDYARIGSQLAQSNLLRAVAATAGFAQVLPDLIPFTRRHIPLAKLSLPFLLVNGSLNPASLAQTSHAAAQNCPLDVIPPDLLATRTPNPSSLRSFADRIQSRLSSGQNAIIQTVHSRSDLPRFESFACQAGILATELHPLVASNVGVILRLILDGFQPGTLIVFGGDTLVGIARALRWSQFVPTNEPLPGITVSSLPGAPNLELISKSGGFGAPDLLDRLPFRKQYS